jgi:ankyrin repeat protein
MRTLISAGADLDKTNILGKTALHWAATIACVQPLEMLIQAGAELDVFDKYGHSPFVCAIQMNNYMALKCLLKAGCDRISVDGLNGTALVLACIKGHTECTDILLDTGDDPDEIGFYGLTPLMSACFESHVDVVKTLLDHGANPSMPGRMGATPLIKALITVTPCNDIRRHKIVAMLIRAGADINVRATAAGYFTCITNGRNCPLSFAMCSGYTSLVQMILLSGSQVLCCDIRDWCTQEESTGGYYDKKSIIDPIKKWKMEAKALKYICRTVIRESIGGVRMNKSEAIYKLPIAPVLQKYVDLSDLDEIEPETAELAEAHQLLQTQHFALQCQSAKVLEGTLLMQTFSGALH